MQKNVFSVTFNSRRYTGLLQAGILCCAFISGPSEANKADLSGVAKEITVKERQLKSHNQNLNELQAQLKKQEQAISEVANKIHSANQSLAKITHQIRDLTKQSAELEQAKKKQIKQLSKIIEGQYRQGKQSHITTILSGDDPTKIDRLTVYAEKLSKIRTETLNDISATDTELQLKRRSLEQQRKKQHQLLEELAVSKASLEKEQQKQRTTAQAIAKQVNTEQAYLDELKNNAKRLKAEVARAAELQRLTEERRVAEEKRIAEQQRFEPQKRAVKMDGLGKYKGKLTWPVNGQVLHRYGSPQSGQLKWNGMVIADDEGKEVRATHDGTVVLSNWLRGYGLMVVIDHGQGDMSFYGYNQALLRNVGDTVQAGEPIALVGNSGGQSGAGLYFEIRRKGTAINPAPWLKRNK